MSFFKKIKEKPDKEKKKILWVSVFLIAFFLIIIWILQLKFTLNNINFNNISSPTIETKGLEEAKENLKEMEKNLQKLQPSPTSSILVSPNTSP